MLFAADLILPWVGAKAIIMYLQDNHNWSWKHIKIGDDSDLLQRSQEYLF